MKTIQSVYAKLRRQNRKNYQLLIGCSFFSVLLITAYVTMMRSPTILSVLPEGGDSRKQVMMIFVLACVGCAVFTTYASSIFFRQKSKETGVFLLLGASRRQLRGLLFRDLAVISFGSCGAGAVLGAPLAWVIWQLFRLFVVDSEEMPLTIDPQAYLFALIFSAFVIGMLFFMGARFLRRTNIIDVVNQSHQSEPIREVKRWYGPVGIALLVAGALAGYLMPSFFVRVLHWYAPEGLSAIFYAPALVGLYMVLLHTVVNGWRTGGQGKYKHIIATSMMKFQGRQTVRNMLVITVLLAGAYFAMFYTPMLGVGAMMDYEARPTDYQYHYRADQDMPQRAEVEALAEENGVDITSWAEGEAICLGVDGTVSVETETKFGITWTSEYQQLRGSEVFLPERTYNALTGTKANVAPGTVKGIYLDDGGDGYMFSGDASRLQNMVTGEVLQTTPDEEKLCYSMLFGRYVMNDADYDRIAAGLTPEWKERFTAFNVADSAASYPFAKALFNEIVDRSSPAVEVVDAYDPVTRMLDEAKGKAYWAAPENQPAGDNISYDQRDASTFRLFWKYMPQFRVFDQNDFVRTTAVFLMLFIFIAIICFAAVMVIAYTRCLTIALNNRQVFDDLRRLGAGPEYRYQAVRGQISRVFFTPCLTGTAVIFMFYTMIMYFNDNRLTPQELAGMGLCLVLIAVLSAVLYLAYRRTRATVCRMLGTEKPIPASRRSAKAHAAAKTFEQVPH